MSTFQTSTLHQTVSDTVFEQLRALLQQMAQMLGAEAVVLTEAVLDQAGIPSAKPFTLVASKPFSVLLSGIRVADGTATQNLAYQISLRFEPEAIGRFLDSWREPPAKAAGRSLLRQAQALLQPNDAIVQSDFTLRLIALLSAKPSDPTEATLSQQLEQERLLNQVTMQIRQSLELPLVLQTAVDQVRQFLQTSRLVIYQLDPPVHLLDSPVKSLAAGGVVAYEATAAAVPSVLQWVEDCNILQDSQRVACYHQGFTLAIEDIEQAYAKTPCLVKFLRKAQVRAKLVAPIEVRGGLWGLLIAHQCDRPRRWQESEQRFLQQIGEHLAIAITQAQLYAQVQQQNQTLERRVAEHTQNLEDALLVAQTANRSKSEFLAAMSHELRTPLTMVIGMSSTLLRWSFGELNQRQRHYLQTIHDSGEHLLQLINDILDLSQLEAGKAILKLSEFSLSQLARQSLRALQEKAAQGAVATRLDLKIDDQWDSFIADPHRVQQILLNLLSNAVKFTPEGGKVTLRVFADEGTAVIQVKDTGIGISTQQQSLLFHKFQQLDASYHRQYEGAGVGLALTKQLVELHGGSITVESKVGIGSVFTVRLPRSQRELSSPGSILPAVRPPIDLGIPDAPAGRIVLVESHEESAGIICDILTAAGYQLIWLLDSSTAIDQIELLQPIAVLLEAQSPHINGYGLLRRLRKNPATQDLKAIVLTNTPAVEEHNRYLALGANECVSKPIRPDDLLQRVLAVTARED